MAYQKETAMNVRRHNLPNISHVLVISDSSAGIRYIQRFYRMCMTNNFHVRPQPKYFVFPVTSEKNFESVGRKNIFFCWK